MRKFNASRLVDARTYNKITGEDLATAVGIKKQAISQFENGKASPEYGTVCKISNVLQFPVQFFMKMTFPYFRAIRIFEPFLQAISVN